MKIIPPEQHELFRQSVVDLATKLATDAAHYMLDNYSKTEMDKRVEENINTFIKRWTE